MKKFFTLAILAAAALTANATTLWEGDVTFTSWDNPISLDGTAFSNVQAGDRLAFTVTAGNAESSIAVRSNPGWGDVPTDVENGDYIYITSGPGIYYFDINEAAAQELATNGVVITGTAYSLSKIELIGEGEEEPPVEGGNKVIWTGEMTVTSWDNTVTLAGSAFGNVKAGDKLAFTVTAGDAGSSIAVRSNPSWGDVPTDKENGDYIYLTEGPGVYYWDINEAAADELNANGVVITGTAYTLTQIELISEGGDEPPVEDETQVIWTGEMTVTSWDNTVTLAGSAFGNVKAGDKLAFTVTAGDAGSSIAVRSNPGWGDVPTDKEDGDYIYLTEGPGVYYWDINAAAADELNTNGVVITGTAYTLTKIELVTQGVESGVKVVDADAKAPVYNLMGVRVADSLDKVTTPGIYISGGRKYVVR